MTHGVHADGDGNAKPSGERGCVVVDSECYAEAKRYEWKIHTVAVTKNVLSFLVCTAYSPLGFSSLTA
ncbi:hypothetical protein [Marinibactrum halimedae]|uniref:Uncharacterized protein n=1 Tax=Marinibactrum halimedae TaxID=1444977 RepID=A0AA37T371_9GAMM|nr:hypothetical protein [Marinibactrum halimedae]MCD9459570.1 hypothetical protein [Marinibactrum halimedae]GLS25613.1 hypothetical protein GCM10007877_13270 [Marinibactrum halimedae]